MVNLAQTIEGAQTTAFTFDAADRLAGVVMPDATQVDFAYDADGQRVSQTADGQSVNYLWDAYSAYGDVVLETDGSGTPLAGYALANGQVHTIAEQIYLRYARQLGRAARPPTT